jgi:hypothetical protein
LELTEKGIITPAFNKDHLKKAMRKSGWVYDEGSGKGPNASWVKLEEVDSTVVGILRSSAFEPGPYSPSAVLDQLLKLGASMMSYAALRSAFFLAGWTSNNRRGRGSVWTKPGEVPAKDSAPTPVETVPVPVVEAPIPQILLSDLAAAISSLRADHNALRHEVLDGMASLRTIVRDAGAEVQRVADVLSLPPAKS